MKCTRYLCVFAHITQPNEIMFAQMHIPLYFHTIIGASSSVLKLLWITNCEHETFYQSVCSYQHSVNAVRNAKR